MTTHVMHFTVSGKYIADQARDLLIERGYNAARAFLKTTFGDQMTVDTMEQILKGEKTLTGMDSDIHLTDQDPEDEEYKAYQEQIRYTYSRVVAFRGRFYEPYATVGALGRDDLPNRYTLRNRYLGFPPTVATIGEFNREWSTYRHLHYTNNPAEDVLVYWQGAIYMWQEKLIHDPPPWLIEQYARASWLAHVKSLPEGNRSPNLFMKRDEEDRFHAALAEQLANGRVFEERGWPQTYGNTERIKNVEVVDDEEPVTEISAPTRAAIAVFKQQVAADLAKESVAKEEPARVSDDFITQLIMETIEDPEKAVGMAAHMRGDATKVVIGEVTDGRYGIISPSGEYYPCLYHEHDALLRQIFKDTGRNLGELSEGEFARKNGWIKVHGNPRASEVIFAGRPSEAALATMREYWAHWHRDTEFDEERWA